jgi:hypothetical protein
MTDHNEEFFVSIEKELYTMLSREMGYSKKLGLQRYEEFEIFSSSPKYEDLSFRIQYTRKRFYTRSFGIYSMLTNPKFPHELIDLWKNKGRLRVVSYGCGPGSDALGFSKFCDQHNIIANCEAYDVENGWGSIISKLNKICNFNIQFVHIQNDFSTNLQAIKGCDVLILSWVVHLIINKNSDEFWQSLLMALPNTAILVRDRFASHIYTTIPNCNQVFLEDTFEGKRNQQMLIY